MRNPSPTFLNDRADNFGSEVNGHDGMGLSKAKTLWLFGEWDALAAVDLDMLPRHPDRSRIALLVASAHQHLGDDDKAREMARAALDWNCPPELAAQILIADVHNTLGRASALKQDERRTTRHFRSAVELSGTRREAELLSHARSVREMVKLGLLPQAASLVDRELAETRKTSERPQQTRARIRVLETELELLHHELSLAQQRQQLFRSSSRSEIRAEPSESKSRVSELKKRSVSQLGQDLWVLEQTGYKQGGFFVEVGATDGVLLNNTWLLEKEFGWRGICVEPNPRFFEQLKRNRSCIVSSDCISDETGKVVEFIFADVYGGISDHAYRDIHAEKRAAYDTLGTKVNIKTISLHDLLSKYNAPQEIDYLSVDTEGSELEILLAFPFSQWKINLLTVEHNFTPQREQIYSYLLTHGYIRINCQWDDWYIQTRPSSTNSHAIDA